MLPPRSLDTMSDAIALSSPNGRMSKRAKEAASKRLGEKLFGSYTGEPTYTPEQIKERRIESLQRHISMLQQLCGHKLASPRDNKTKRAVRKAQAELAELGQLQVGDKVTFTNDQGVSFPGKTITKVETFTGDIFTGQTRYYYTPTDTPWFPVPAKNLTKDTDARP